MNVKKRIMSAVISLIIALMNTAAFAVGTPAIIVSSPTASAGETVDVTVSLANNPGIVSMRLSIGYNSDVLTLKKVTDADILGTSFHSNDLKLNPYILYWSNGAVASDFKKNGNAVTLSFDVAADAEVGDYPITVSYNREDDDILNAALKPVEFETTSGKVIVQKMVYDTASKIMTVTSGTAYSDVQAIIAVYNNGRFSALKTKKISIKKGTTDIKFDDFEVDGADTVKTMIWEDNAEAKPLFNACTNHIN